MNARIIAAGVVALALAFLGGRYSRPAEVRTVEKKVEVVRESQGAVARVDVSSRNATVANERVVTRIVTRPGGIRVVERWRETGTSTVAEAKAAEVRIEWKEREKLVEVTKEKTVTAMRPQWAIGVDTLLAKSLDTGYGASIERRIVGPVWLRLGAIKMRDTYAATLSGRIEF